MSKWGRIMAYGAAGRTRELAIKSATATLQVTADRCAEKLTKISIEDNEGGQPMESFVDGFFLGASPMVKVTADHIPKEEY